MTDTQKTATDQIQRPDDIDVENVLLQMDTYDLQINTWQHNFKQKENAYDEYVNKLELKLKALETELLDLQRTQGRFLRDTEGLSNTERTNSMQAKKSQLLQYRQTMEQEISIPVNEFAAMEVASENTVSEGNSDREAMKEALSLAFYQNLGIELHSNPEQSRHRMKLVSYDKPSVSSFTFNENGDTFADAQKIWDCISP